MVNGIRTIYPSGLNKGISSKLCVWTREFDMKHLNKAEGRIGQNIVSITMKMKTIVRIFALHRRNLDK